MVAVAAAAGDRGPVGGDGVTPVERSIVGGKFATAAVTLLPGSTTSGSLPPLLAPTPDPGPPSPSRAPGPISRRTIQALSGLSL